jgi:hypothetical protein
VVVTWNETVDPASTSIVAGEVKLASESTTRLRV